MKKLIIVTTILLSGLVQSCGKEFVDDCKDFISGAKSHVKVSPPKGCDENEFLK